MNDFFENISPSLKERVKLYIIANVLRRNQVFLLFLNRVCEESIRGTEPNRKEQRVMNMIVKLMTIMFVEPEELVVKQSSSLADNPYMYVLEKGECIVKVKDKQKLQNEEKQVRKLYPGEYFGVSPITCFTLL